MFPPIVFSLVTFVVSLIFVVKSSDFIVTKAAELANQLRVPLIFIGLTVASIGTSLPEIFTSLTCGLKNHSGLAIGNIIGSYIVQITLLIGVCALVPVKHLKQGLRISTSNIELEKDGMIMLFALVVLFFVMIGDLTHKDIYIISQLEGCFLIIIYFIYLWYLYKRTKRAPSDVDIQKNASGGIIKNLFLILIGFLILIISADHFVSSAVDLAKHLKVPEPIIGLTLVSFGTSVPELAVSLVAIIKGDTSLSIGNLIGSNITDPLFSIGAGALIRGFIVEELWTILFNVPFGVLSGAITLIFLMTRGRMEKWEAVIIIAIYCLFLLCNLPFLPFKDALASYFGIPLG
jgi:cation:H+ antiporter